MFYTYHSNKIELLKELTLQIMEIDPLEEVFAEEFVLVQSPGMTKWLMQEVANSKRICANMKFPLSSSFLWNIFSAVLPDVPKNSAFTKDSMQWTLAKILPELLESNDYRALNNYLGLGDVTETKIHQLANRIADVFDGYQVYRPDWILNWEAGEIDEELVKGQEWQPKLWNELSKQILNEGKPHYHRANMYGEFINAVDKFIAEGKSLPNDFPSRIFIFGVSSLPPHYLNVLEALGKLVDVHFMFFNPCHMYWGDIKDRKYTNRVMLKQYQKKLIQGNLKDKYEDSLFVDATDSSVDETLDDSIGNALLSSMGKLGRDNLSMLSQLEGQQEISAFVEGERSSLLEMVKDDIFNLENKGDDSLYENSKHKEAIKHSDLSISVNSCFSSKREIEVLQNQLLSLFEKDPTLTPRDIIVMCADINKYSPYIEAVFGNVPKFDKRHIPFSISDKTAEHEHPIVASFLRLIDVNKSRYTAVEVMELLKTNAVLNRFGIEPDDFNDLHDVVKGVGVRWGLDKGTSEKFDLPQLDVNTWKFGINRLLVGYGMPMETGFFEETLPYDLPMNVSYELIGKLAKFVNKLQFWHDKFSGEHSYKEWFTMLDTMVEDFFDVRDNADFSAMELIKKTLQRLYTVLDDVNYESAIPLAVIAEEINQRLSKEQISQRFLAGKLNFCTLMPMRSIPFKVVCLVGMNDGVYPRNTVVANYDLMGRNPQVGDRSRRNDDRYMFMEAILSAEEKLYISYIGNSPQDGAAKNPSILVQELLDYCTTGYRLEGDEELNVDESSEKLLDNIVVKQAMNPYSAGDFGGKVGSYSHEWAKAINTNADDATDFCNTPLEIGEKDLDEGDVYRLNLSELMMFWKLPVRHFFTRRLKASLTVESDSLKEDEPFSLDALEAYTLRKDWIGELIGNNSQDVETSNSLHEKVLRDNIGGGKAPIGGFGEVMIAKERLSVEELSSSVIHLKQGEDTPLDVNIHVNLQNGDAIKVQGLVRDVYEDGVICYRVGKVRAADIFDAWIRQLVLCASGVFKDVYVLGLKDSKLIKPVKEEIAVDLLTDLVELYYLGLTQPLPFMVDVATEGLKASGCATGLNVTITEQDTKTLKRMQTVFDRAYIENKDFGDSHVVRVWSEWTSSLGVEIHKMGERVLEPCLAYTTKIDL
ncbi:exodeoxyribonuclease V subunit gamma [Vibrio crassostreae]|uniref:exodeoxyribonuclease V subunit gamma n=1 Tax=Vibrio crassostreae TaxID=246167 RepID=UPI001B310942|nr:exodeoxyribonuclease V subunit gamma [Vibrio crassostreae]